MPERKPNSKAAGGGFDILPAIDLLGGRVVRLLRGDFATGTAYGEDPVAIASEFVEMGARWLHVVDLEGARDADLRQTALVAEIARAVGERACVEIAGGFRDEEAVATMLAAGAARVVVGTAALRDPAFVGRLVAEFGAERVAVALDVRGGLAVGQGWAHGSAGVPVAEALERVANQGVATFEVTAIDRDGTLTGPDLELLSGLVVARRGAIIASAGIRSADDLRAAAALGCAGAIVGRALYEGHLTLADALAAVVPT